MRTYLLKLVAAAYLAVLPANASSSSTSLPAEQRTWKGATTYPTTITRSWTRTLTAKSTASATSSINTDILTVQTVTLYEAWPSSPNPEHFPYTLLQTAVTSRQLYSAKTNTDGKAVPTGAALSSNIEPSATTPRTVTSTWLLWDTSPTDLAVGEALPVCEKPGGHRCATPNLKQDTRCAERSLTTACHSQCKIRRVEGWDVWQCHKVGDGTSKFSELKSKDAETDTRMVALGRVCTDSMGYWEQLLEPCDSMDHGYECPPCNG
ncbi:hypothetical protein SBRCBS47491_007665 [Sporothrix bragantina]|uniref:Uncharacterized protein n=1 Tax=Sporothrix bragantina TaxID=671064 RepID=A0ABP0CGB1_9PEZI